MGKMRSEAPTLWMLTTQARILACHHPRSTTNMYGGRNVAYATSLASPSKATDAYLDFGFYF